MKYISKNSNKWIYRIILIFFSMWIIIELIQILDSIKAGENITFLGLVIPFLICLFLTQLNTVSYDDSDVYIINYKGTRTHPRIDFDKIIPVISFLNFYWVCFNSNKERYLFFAGNMNIIGSFDSESVAKQLTIEVKIN